MTIDLFEMQVLVEACWNMQTGVRSGVLQKCINEWHNELSPGARKASYLFWKRAMPEPTNGYTAKVLARFNPDNQYVVTIENTDVPCYKHGDNYYRDSIYWLPEDLITGVEKI